MYDCYLNALMVRDDIPELTREDRGDYTEFKTTVTSRRELLGVLGVAGIGGLAGCTGDDTGPGSSEMEDTDGDTRLTVGIQSEPWNFDPALHSDTGSALVMGLVYDKPITVDPETDDLRADLCTEVPETLDDGQTWRYTLQEGITFHDGSELTAEDLAYNFDWAADPDNSAQVLSYAPQLENAETEIIDDYTVELTLNEPQSMWNSWMTRIIEGLVPADSRGGLEEAKGPKGIGTNLTTNPIGTGPFEYEEWQTGSHVHMTAFDDHWREDIPHVDEFRFEITVEPSSRLSQLRSGSSDMMKRVPAKDFEALESEPGITSESVTGARTLVTYTNLVDNGENPMANVHNRRAVLHSVPTEEIVERVFQGQAIPQTGPWFPDSDLTSPKLKEMDLYDLDQAEAELEQGPDPDGFEVELMTENVPFFMNTAEIIQNELSQIGVDVEIVTLEKSSLFDRLYGNIGWELALNDWTNGIPHVMWWLFADKFPQRNHNNWHHEPEDGELSDPWKPSGPAPPEYAQDEFGTEPGSGHLWFRSRINEALQTADTEARNEIAFELQEYVIEQAICIDICYVNRIDAWQDSIEGYKFGRWNEEYNDVQIND